MKLVQRTSNTLTMRYVPWLTWLMASYLLLKMLLLIGYFLIFGVPNRLALTCTRNIHQPMQGDCQLTGTAEPESAQQRWDLDQIIKAKLFKTVNDRGDEIYYLALMTKREPVTLPISSKYPGNIEPLVTKIQEFLANPTQTHVTVPSDDRLIRTLAVVLLLIFLGVGLTYMIVVEGSIRTLRLNKITGKLTLQKRSLLGTKSVEYPLKKVANVFVIRGKGGRVGILLLQENSDLSDMSLLSKLMWIWKSILWLHPFEASLRRSECERCAEEIRDFLDLPVPPTKASDKTASNESKNSQGKKFDH